MGPPGRRLVEFGGSVLSEHGLAFARVAAGRLHSRPGTVPFVLCAKTDEPWMAMPKKSAPEFQQMLAWLATELIYARAEFTIVRGLRRIDQAVRNAAPIFFEMTLGVCADSVLLHVARLFDHRRGSVSIHTLLSAALDNAGTFKHGTPADVRKAVAEARVSISSLSPILNAIHHRRNQTVAHSAPEPILDPRRYVQQGRVSYRELGVLLTQTGIILNRFSQLYRGALLPLDLPGANDYRNALDLIALSLNAARGKATTP